MNISFLAVNLNIHTAEKPGKVIFWWVKPCSFLSVPWTAKPQRATKNRTDRSSMYLTFFKFFGGLESVDFSFCLCCPFCIFEICLDSNPENCRSKQARCQLSHPSTYLATHLPSLFNRGCWFKKTYYRTAMCTQKKITACHIQNMPFHFLHEATVLWPVAIYTVHCNSFSLNYSAK
jgi:hypothetical protein